MNSTVLLGSMAVVASIFVFWSIFMYCSSRMSIDSWIASCNSFNLSICSTFFTRLKISPVVVNANRHDSVMTAIKPAPL